MLKLNACPKFSALLLYAQEVGHCCNQREWNKENQYHIMGQKWKTLCWAAT